MKTIRHASGALVMGLALGLLCGGCGSNAPAIGGIFGTVVDDLGNPVAGVSVTVGAETQPTNGIGQFSFTAVSAGAHSVAASRAGYVFTSQAVTVRNGQTTTVVINGARSNDAPALNASASPTTITFVGGSTTLSVLASDANGDTLNVTLTGPDGTVPLTDLGGGLFRATVLVPANNSQVAQTLNYQFAANDGRTTSHATVSVTVQALQVPGGTGGGNEPGGGGPPTPNI